MLLAAPRGFCAGVEMAIKALAWMVRAFEPPVYCYHEIVHNQRVVKRFEDLGVVFVDDIAEVPTGAPVMLSAHGSAPEVVQAARDAGGYVVDAVCPLVTKVHHEVKVRAGKGYRIVYVGHEGHEEAVGTMAVAPDAIDRVESVAEVAALPESSEPVALLAQTTLSHRDWQGVLDATRERWPDLWTPGRSDLCFATTNRQSALLEIAPRCDALVVLGSANSSNTRALERLGRDAGCPRVYRVNNADELPADLSGVVGVTAGASAPEELVESVIARLAPRAGRRGGAHHRRGRVLPAAAQPARPAHHPRPGGHLRARRLADRPRAGERPRGRGQRRAGHALVSETVTMAATFTRMDESTAEQWGVIGAETTKNQPRVAEQFLTMLRQLEGITDGFATDQLVHVCQTATRAERAGADPEVVFASLCHDIGKVVSVFNHPAIAAEMIKPYVRPEVYEMIRVHQDFQGRHYYAHFGGDPDARDQYEGADYYDLAARFADEWDQTSFDPDYDTLPLEHFEPLVREMTASPRYS